MPESTAADLDQLALAALSIGDIQSAAIFVVAPDPGTLVLGAAAGIEGPALDGLAAAVRNPAHPVARALSDPGPTFDVLPTAPGGPRLRSHLPLRPNTGGGGATVGVLAVAHESPLDESSRRRLVDLAASIAATAR